MKQSLMRLSGKLMAAHPVSALTMPGIARNHVNVIYSHYFGRPRPYLYKYNASTMSLEALVALLTKLRRYFVFSTVGEILADGLGAETAVPNRLAVTFDDGFDLVREGVIDVLRAQGVRATFFVITDCLDNRHLMWRNKLLAMISAKGRQVVGQHLLALHDEVGLTVRTATDADPLVTTYQWPMDRKEDLVDDLWQRCDMPPVRAFLDEHKPYFSLGDLRRLQRDGHEIGLHSRTHPLCPRLSDAQIEQEFVGPAQWLKETFGLTQVPMSYPFGPRLPAAAEQRLVSAGIVSAALGVRGFTRRPAEPCRLDRADVERCPEFQVFARPMVPSVFRSALASSPRSAAA